MGKHKHGLVETVGYKNTTVFHLPLTIVLKGQYNILNTKLTLHTIIH